MKFKTVLVTLCILIAGICVNAGSAEERYIIKFNDAVQLFNADGSESAKDYCSVTADELQEYIDAGVVESYGIDYVVELDTKSWNLSNIKAEFPEKLGCTGQDVKVAVIDSGMVSGFAGNALEGYNYLDGNTDTDDTMGHGTAVSAIIASTSYGVAYNAQFVPLKCFESDVTTYTSDIIDAVVDAVDVYDCDVINMSFSFTGDAGGTAVQTFKEKVDYAAEKGAILIASVGNDGDDTLNYPAAFTNVIGVGSVDADNKWSDFSNYNSSVFVTAPGEGLSLFGVTLSGTSFSAPHVSGLAAVAKCIEKGITVEGFANVLSATSVREDDSGENNNKYDVYCGYGVIDCEAAVKKIIENDAMFISPVVVSESMTSAVIYNNTVSDRTVCCICAYYDENGRLTECIPVNVEINSGDVYGFNNEYSKGYTQYFVWSGLETLTPLAKPKG